MEAALPDPPDSLQSGAWSPYMQVCGEVSFLGMSKDMLVFPVYRGVLESDFSGDVQANFGC